MALIAGGEEGAGSEHAAKVQAAAKSRVRRGRKAVEVMEVTPAFKEEGDIIYNQACM
jgi:hypothetical protein